MKKITIHPYRKEDYHQWNTFIRDSKNATFLFHRDFMEYHSNRFEDYSLILKNEEQWIAVLPANRVENQIFSHQGLTYGGLIYNDKLKLATVIAIFKELLNYLFQKGIIHLHIKLIPTIYHHKPADELSYILFLVQAQLTRRDSLSVLDLRQPLVLSKDRKQGVKKGIKKGLEIRETTDFDLFWNSILIPNLSKKHQAKPVHSLEEITYLKNKFPDHIRQFNVYHNHQIVAGTTIFLSENVAHSQYISGTDDNNENGSLDLLHYHLLTEVFSDKCYFDFGISNEQNGTKLNLGLSYWKESFGASSVSHDFYKVETQRYSQLESVFI